MFPPDNRLELVFLPDSKHRGRQVNSGGFDTVGELRADTGRTDTSDDLATLDTGLLELENVGHGNHFAFHALDFGDLDHFSRAVAQTLLMADDVHRAGNL